MSAVWAIILFLSLATAALGSSDPQCLDESGNPVDWYTLYKLPREEHKVHSNNPLVNEGVAYAYMTSKSEQRWRLSKRSIEDPESIAGRTLAPLYRDGTKSWVKICGTTDSLEFGCELTS